MELETLATRINQKHQKNNSKPENRIDSVCVLEKGIIFNELVNGIYSALPEPNSKMTFHESENPLMFFYSLISRFLNQAWIPSFNFLKFTKHVA